MTALALDAIYYALSALWAYLVVCLLVAFAAVATHAAERLARRLRTHGRRREWLPALRRGVRRAA